jgi:hypothetical protein
MQIIWISDNMEKNQILNELFLEREYMKSWYFEFDVWRWNLFIITILEGFMSLDFWEP